MTSPKTPDDAALEAALAMALVPDAEDVAPLSQAVLSRMVEDRTRTYWHIGDVLTDPLPAGGLMLAALLAAGALGYGLLTADLQETQALYLLLGQGF